MELALQAQIVTDLTSLFLVDSSPTGDGLLDEILTEIKNEPDRHPSTWWIDSVSLRHDNLVNCMLDTLVKAGILREEERTFLSVFSHHAYPPVTGREEREAKGRLISILFNDESAPSQTKSGTRWSSHRQPTRTEDRRPLTSSVVQSTGKGREGLQLRIAL